MSSGVKHLIECHCTLKIYQGSDNHIYHKFPVYSKFDDNGKIIVKIVPCNHCQTLHKVTDICKSEIIRSGKDENSAAMTKEDIELQISQKLSNVLKRYDSDISDWEHALDIIESESWGSKIVLSRDILEDTSYQIKTLIILAEDKFKIVTSKVTNDVIFEGKK